MGQGDFMIVKRTLVTVILLGSILALITGCLNESPPPANQSPRASFTASPTSGEAPLGVTFNASASFDPDGSITSYVWTFGDGGSSSGATAAHTYTSAGTYTARLRITDNDGATDTITHNILVQAPAPPPITVWITASESEIDILSYEIEDGVLWYTLVGRAKNITSRTLDWVTINARLLDETNVQIDTTSDLVSDVLPNTTFEFSLWIFEPERTKMIEIYEITTLCW